AWRKGFLSGASGVPKRSRVAWHFSPATTHRTSRGTPWSSMAGWPCEESWQGGDDMDVLDRVKELVVEQLGVDAEEVTEDASFVDDLGADSLDIVELVMAFEEEFDLEIPDEDAEKIRTVGDAARYIKEKLG